MVDRTPATVPPRQHDALALQLADVGHLCEWVLVPANDYTRVVDPQHQYVVLVKVVVAVDPVLQRQIREHVMALRDEDGLFDKGGGGGGVRGISVRCSSEALRR